MLESVLAAALIYVLVLWQIHVVAAPEQMSSPSGGAYLYVSDQRVSASMVVSLDDVNGTGPEAKIDVEFLGESPGDWALLLTGDARFTDGNGIGGTSATATPGTAVTYSAVPAPPLTNVPPGERAQLFLGSTATFVRAEGLGLLSLTGRLRGPLSSHSYAKREYAFPAYGRVSAPLGFEGVEGNNVLSPVEDASYLPPTSFVVSARLADAGEVTGDIVQSNPQLDPGVPEPAWVSGTSVAARFVAEDVTKQQATSFTVGALVGVAGSLLATGLAALATGLAAATRPRRAA